jgi:Domain of unknown function (DUF4214)/Protein of unknown function (DUF1416)
VTATGVQVSGRIADAAGAGIRDVWVRLTASNGAFIGEVFTDTIGRYQFFVAPNDRYTLTMPGIPPGLTFTPNTRSVMVGSEDVGGLDFTVAAADGVSAFVAGLYSGALGRALDNNGFTFWARRLREQCGADQLATVAQSFFDSLEFRTRPLTLPAVVTALYRALLGREPEPGGLTAWVGVLRHERLALAASFVDSAEFQRQLPDRTNRQAVATVVTRLYTEILGRAPDPDGSTGWVDSIVTSGDLKAAAIAFLTSDELEGRALTFRDYVTLLYRGLLGRDGDGPGLDRGEDVLQSSLLSVIGELVASDEFRRRIAGVCGS